MTNVAARLDRFLRSQGFAIIGVSIGNPLDKNTWTVQPPELQAAARAAIRAFVADDPSHAKAEAAAQADDVLQRADVKAIIGLLEKRFASTTTRTHKKG